MHVMKRAVQALCVATSFPWAAVGSSAASGSISCGNNIVGRSLLQSKALINNSSFGSAGRKSSLLAFVVPASVSANTLNHRSPRSSTRMSSSSNSNIQQTKNRVALLQLPVTSDKSQNIKTAKEYITKAHEAGAQLCVLPEIWNSPYATSAFPEYAEVLPNAGDSLSSGTKSEWGESSIFLMEMAQSTKMYIVGGSIPEISSENIYNTCLIINPSGTIVGKHRKVHLFDVNVPGGIQFKESETLTSGEGATYFDVEGEEDDDESGLGRIGVGICYDIRFPEYAMLLTQMHRCKILIYPGAFNLTTGPAHWELLQRARAVDGQCFVLTASPARMPPPKEDDENKKSKYPHYSAWGHSTVVSPWGEIVATCDEKPAMVVADLDMEKVEEMRMGIPTMGQKRHDLYRLVKGDDAKE